MELTADQRAMLPTEDDVLFYKEHGWWVSPEILDPEVLDDAQSGAERHWTGERDWTLPITGGFKEWRPGDPEGLRVGEIIALQNREIRRLAEQPIISAIAARLAGSDEVRLWESELIQKPPQAASPNATVGWHTDRAYWMTCTSTEMLTAWIPFHDCPPELGPLMVVDGSHLWPELDHDSLREFQNADLDGMATRLLAEHPEATTQTMALHKGQVSFHNSRALHASGANVGDWPRVCLALHLQDGANRYRPYRNARGDLWEVVADRLCRRDSDGHPDYSDPDVCPTFWRSR
jgi:hypothetical protein